MPPASLTMPPRIGNHVTGRRLGADEVIVFAFLLLVCFSSYGTPVFGPPGSAPYQSIWSVHVIGRLSVALVALVAVAGSTLLASWAQPARASSLDGRVAGLLLLLAGLQLVAHVRASGDLLYQQVDIGNLGFFAGGYYVMSRAAGGERDLRRLTAAVGLAVLIHAAYITIRYGLIGSTGFSTSSGRLALLVTEDSLLVGWALVLAWGLVVDRLGGRRFALATGLLVAAVLVVELVSLRRGALIFLCGLVCVRALWLPARARRLAAAALIAVVLSVVAASAAGSRIASDATYAVTSSLLLSHDASSAQKRAELRNYGRNVGGVGDVLLGRGLGAVWEAIVPSPADTVSFGNRETAFVRVGWHVYGLDWLYKIGAVGVLAVVFVTVDAARLVRRRLPRLHDLHSRSYVRSLGLLAPVLFLFLFTNSRLALFAGLCAGAVSSFADRAVAAAPSATEPAGV